MSEQHETMTTMDTKWADHTDLDADFDFEETPPVIVAVETVRDSDNEPEAENVEEVQKEKENKPVCRFFNKKSGCKKGSDCDFAHNRLPCAFFTSEKGCNQGTRCPFTHDENAPRNTNLHQCPNENCDNLCIGKQCSDCHNAMSRPARRQRPRYSTELRECPECHFNKCRGRRCRECHFRNNQDHYRRPTSRSRSRSRSRPRSRSRSRRSFHRRRRTSYDNDY